MKINEKVALYFAATGLCTFFSFIFIYLIRFLTHNASPVVMSSTIFHPMLLIGVLAFVVGVISGVQGETTDFRDIKDNGYEIILTIIAYLSLLTLSVCISTMIFYEPIFDKLSIFKALSAFVFALISLANYIVCLIFFLKEKPVKKVDTIKTKNSLSQS